MPRWGTRFVVSRLVCSTQRLWGRTCVWVWKPVPSPIYRHLHGAETFNASITISDGPKLGR